MGGVKASCGGHISVTGVSREESLGSGLSVPDLPNSVSVSREEPTETPSPYNGIANRPPLFSTCRAGGFTSTRNAATNRPMHVHAVRGDA
jgi:hypothetical protein